MKEQESSMLLQDVVLKILNWERKQILIYALPLTMKES